MKLTIDAFIRLPWSLTVPTIGTTAIFTIETYVNGNSTFDRNLTKSISLTVGDDNLLNTTIYTVKKIKFFMKYV